MNSVRSDLLFGLVIITATVLMATVVIPLGVDSPGNVDILALSPSFWPYIITSMMALIGVIMTLRAGLLLRTGTDVAATPHVEEAETDPDTDGSRDYSFAQASRRVAMCLVILFAYYLALEPLGFVAGSVLVIVALTLLTGERRAHVIAPVALLAPILLYLFFTHVAVVRIPLGLFEEWIT
jgi:putative tricarboxylic transport membrane protein